MQVTLRRHLIRRRPMCTERERRTELDPGVSGGRRWVLDVACTKRGSEHADLCVFDPLD